VGGADHPSRMNGRPIRCSDVTALSAAVLCTGFPARFSFTDGAGTDSYFAFMSGFAKVRMLGSAAHSICLIARGAADCYAERSIMFWDVAAGVAVSQGAGVRLLMPDQLTLEPSQIAVAHFLVTDATSLDQIGHRGSLGEHDPSPALLVSWNTFADSSTNTTSGVVQHLTQGEVSQRSPD